MALGFAQPLIEVCTEDRSGGRARPTRKADNLTAICELMPRQYGILELSQHYGPPRPPVPVTGITLRFIYR
jgi:hypothetical protein